MVAGYLMASGYCMRCFIESVAVALLVSEPTAQAYERICAEARGRAPTYPVHKAVAHVPKFADKLGIPPELWKAWREMNKHYDATSHASLYALGAIYDHTVKTGSVGAAFDEFKMPRYRGEIERMTNAARALQSVILFLDERGRPG